MNALYVISAVLIAAAIAAFLADVPPSICVAIGAAGMAMGLLSVLVEIRRDGFSVGAAEMLFAGLGLACGVTAFVFRDVTPVLVASLIGFILFVFLHMFAEFIRKSLKLKAAIRRWKKSRKK